MTSVSQIFSKFLDNLRINNSEKISMRYGEITTNLNKYFRNTASNTANTLRVGSYGRYTGIKGISDLDMLYILPNSLWNTYKNSQYKLLRNVRDAVLMRYPSTSIHVDRLVVCVQYRDFYIEIQPVFEKLGNDDLKYYLYPDTYNGGSWKITKPIHEIKAMKEFVDQKNKNLRRLCKMVRAWKNKQGVNIGGLLIDTLVYNFFKSTNYYDDKYFGHYHYMSRDFFDYLAHEGEKQFYFALGSNQKVKVKEKFQKKAKKAYELCIDAIDNQNNSKSNLKWREIYGNNFPNNEYICHESYGSINFTDTEEFIEDYYKINIIYNLEIDCEVKQNGFREHTLLYMLLKHIPLFKNKQLKFIVINCDVPHPYELKWKVLNRGREAERRNEIRGQIINGTTNDYHVEYTKFSGNHLVECYAIKEGVVVARDSINVPIQNF